MSFAKPAVAFAVRNVCRQLLYRSAEPWTPTRYQSDKAGRDLGVALSHEGLQEFEKWGRTSRRVAQKNSTGGSKKIVEIVEAGMKLSSNTKQKYRLNMIEQKLSLSDA